MGGSKKQTVGYKYFLGMHQILILGPADFMSRYTVDDRVAWKGRSTGGPISVFAESLFGGESREGGVSGTMDLEMGYLDQEPNQYLWERLTGTMAPIPAFRQVVGVVMRQMYLGNNPYLKKNSFRLQRIHIRSEDEEQWYDEKAEIKVLDEVIVPVVSSGWEYVQLPEQGNPGYSNLTPPSEGWASGTAPFGSGGWVWPGQPARQTNWAMGTVLWLRRQISVPANRMIAARVRAENGAVLFLNGAIIGYANRDNVQVQEGEVFDFTLPPGNHEIMVKAFDEVPTLGDTYVSVEIVALTEADMNPAHIIRECLTDKTWGMGYHDEDIDDVSFMAAADRLYDEAMGISLLWDRQMPIEQFIQEIVKHINAALYVGRSGETAGKFILKLIRDDYDEEDLLHFDEGSIERVDNFKRVEFGELTNSVTVNYWDSYTGKDASTTAQDPALVQQQGAVINTTVQYPGFTNAEIANRVALRDLLSLSTPLCSCVIYVYPGNGAESLNIGDVIAVSWEDYGLVRLPMRISAMTLGDGKTNKIKLTVTQDVFGLPAAGVIVPPDVGWENPNQEPAPIQRQVAQEATYYELVQQFSQSVVDTQLATEPDMGMVIASASRQQGSSINARFLTDDGSGYEDVGGIDFSPSAILNDSVGKMDNVFIIRSGIELSSVTAGEYATINGEMVVVVEIDGTEMTVKRGALDTVPEEHAAGSVIMFADPWFQADPTEYVASDQVSVKLLNVTGIGTSPESEAIPMEVELNSRAIRPLPPGNFKVNGFYFPTEVADGDVTITFATRNRVLQTGGELVGFTDGDVTPEPGTTYRVDVRDAVTDVLLDSVPGPSSPIIVPQASFTTNEARLNLFSVRDGYDSWQPQSAVVETGLALWTPANLSPSHWYDFSDAGTVTLAGGAVSAISNKGSAGGLATQATSSSQPVMVTAAQNGLNVANFDGSNDHLSLSFATTAKMTIWVMFRRASAGILSQPLGGSNNSAPPYATQWWTDNVRYSAPWGGSSFATHGSASTLTGVFQHILVKGASSTSLYQDGTLIGTPQLNGSGTGMMSAIGRRASNYHNGWIGEIGVVAAEVSSADREKLEGYLAHKWGLTANLDDAHPYKLAPPIVSGYGSNYGKNYGE